MTMQPATLDEALARLIDDPRDAAAIEALAAHVRAMALRMWSDPALAEDASQEVLIKLFQRAHTGRLQIRRSGRGLVRAMLWSTMVDLLRRQRSDHGIPDIDIAQHVDPDPGAPEQGSYLLVLLERAHAYAVTHPGARDPVILTEAWEDLWLQLTTDVAVPDLVRRRHGIQTNDPGWHNARTLFYQHQLRLRTALRLALEAMTAAGLLDEAEQDYMSEMLRLLVYCQKSKA